MFETRDNINVYPTTIWNISWHDVKESMLEWRQKENPHPVLLNYPKISSFVNIHDIAKKLGKHMYLAMSYMSR